MRGQLSWAWLQDAEGRVRVQAVWKHQRGAEYVVEGEVHTPGRPTHPGSIVLTQLCWRKGQRPGVWVAPLPAPSRMAAPSHVCLFKLK